MSGMPGGAPPAPASPGAPASLDAPALADMPALLDVPPVGSVGFPSLPPASDIPPPAAPAERPAACSAVEESELQAASQAPKQSAAESETRDPNPVLYIATTSPTRGTLAEKRCQLFWLTAHLTLLLAQGRLEH
jgi:hypothetical protein